MSQKGQRQRPNTLYVRRLCDRGCLRGRSAWLEAVLDVVVVAGGSGAGDHFAEEAGEEEHRAQDHGEEGQVEEGLVRDGAETDALRLVDELRGDDPVKHPSDKLKVGDIVKVWVLSVDENKGRISLTMKGAPDASVPGQGGAKGAPAGK